ncbi:MAG TPA: tetratricopeptide repeat protein [Chitinophagaceae bacterium]|nr:tetratricopeptide repeat protein [Chitinophagaceae bacterium]
MFKKLNLFFALSFMIIGANAQKANIQSAFNYLKDKDVAGAKKMIDEAVVSESTKNNAKAWLLKAVIYQAIGTKVQDDMPQMTFILNEEPYIIDLASANSLASSNPNAIAQSIEAYKKVISLDTKYSKDEIRPLLQNILGTQFNDGITKMNDNKYLEAYTALEGVNELAKIDNGNLWKGNPALDTAFANARMYQANCAYNTNKEEEAISLMEECIKNPITQNPDLYIMLTDLYSKKNNDAKWSETMAIARAKYPNEKRILTNEINYYLEKGKIEESIAKLKDGIALEPKKADLYLLLGQTYLGMSNPMDKTGKSLPRPANAKELEQNAITNYAKAAELDERNAYAQFNLGLIYYNQAKIISDEMNKSDNKKFDALKPGRDELITKAMPYLSKAKELIDREGLNDGNRSMYKESLTGLMNCYNVLSKNDKVDEIKKILDSLK